VRTGGILYYHASLLDNDIVGLETKTKTWPCLACKKQRHLEQNFPLTDLAKIRLLTVIEEKTSLTEFSFS
jgi:hypothetical protein